jgi:hypothetical protein
MKELEAKIERNIATIDALFNPGTQLIADNLKKENFEYAQELKLHHKEFSPFFKALSYTVVTFFVKPPDFKVEAHGRLNCSFSRSIEGLLSFALWKSLMSFCRPWCCVLSSIKSTTNTNSCCSPVCMGQTAS